jgi:predicted MFS family arabinose efflux permease
VTAPVSDPDAQESLWSPYRRRHRNIVIGALGLVQIIAWGSSYYLIAVLAKPIADDTGWPLTWVIGGTSVGLLTAGLISQEVGHAIQKHGGRPVLVASTMLLAAGLLGLGFAPSLPFFFAAWVVLGLGMGAGLYDAAFGTLGRLYGTEARSAITTLTLYGGFASTICWPLSALLVEQLGWRGACLTYAGIHLGFSLPILLAGIPKADRNGVDSTARAASTNEHPYASPRNRKQDVGLFVLLAAVLTLASIVMSVISVHLLTILQTALGLDLVAAVSMGAVVGPSQVGARLVEMAFGRRYHPVWTLVASVVLVALSLGLLMFGFPLIAAALTAYGAGNGLNSIARGSLPLALFGPSRYPVWMGRLATPTLIAGALAPSAGALLIDTLGSASTLQIVGTLAAMNVPLVLFLFRCAR